MFRAFSTRRSPHGSEKLVDESALGLLEGTTLKRYKTLPARIIIPSSKLPSELTFPTDCPLKPATARKVSKKSHPLFRLFDTRRKKKTTAKPEFARYLEYVREGGMWDVSSNTPVIYYK